MTPDEKAAARERARASRAAQGLPEHVDDPVTLDAIAAIVRGADAPPPRRTGAEHGSTDAIDTNRGSE